jgi:hypothetical protein
MRKNIKSYANKTKNKSEIGKWKNFHLKIANDND